MHVKESAIYNFSHTIGPTTYNFSIPADSKEHACQILKQGLELVLVEIEKELKSGTKAN